MNRAERRREEKALVEFEKELEDEKYAIRYHTKIFDEDTGKNIDFLSSYCPFCRNDEPTVYTLAEWSDKQNRWLAKVTGIDEMDGGDTFDFYCYACAIGVSNTDVMKRFIETSNTERGKIERFPDEYFGSSIQSMKENHPEIMGMVREIEDTPEGIEMADAIRCSKAYKAYPKSLSDEDRLFMTLFSWGVRFRPIEKSLSEDEAYEEWTKLMKLEGVPEE